MELHIAQDHEGNIHIVDNHKNLPDKLARSHLMVFPGERKRDVFIAFEKANLKIGRRYVWEIEHDEE